jgi:hypothetical protein
MKMLEIVRSIAWIQLFVVPSAFGVFGNTSAMGLSIIVGVVALGLSHLDSLASFKGAGVELVMKDKLEKLIAKSTEPDQIESSGAIAVPESTWPVLKAMSSSSYTWRSLHGIKGDTNLSHGAVQAALDWLCVHGYVDQTGEGKILWALTEKGRAEVLKIGGAQSA